MAKQIKKNKTKKAIKKVPKEAAQKTSRRSSKEASQEASQKFKKKTPTRSPKKSSRKTSKKISSKTSQKFTKKTSQKTSQKAVAKISPRLIVRQATPDDVDHIHELVRKVYEAWPPYPSDMIRGQINNFPEGHLVAELEGKIVGYCASIIVDGDHALRPHTWRTITGGGFGVTHNPEGEYLYGYEICVDPDIRGRRIGQRFYNERKKICRYYHLKGIIFGGRLTQLRKRLGKLGSVEAYIDSVKNKKIKDPVLSFQLRNGFEIIGILWNYLPNDQESMGHAAHLLWRNPAAQKDEIASTYKGSTFSPGRVRVATVQYGQKRIKSFKEFKQYVTYYVDVVADYKSDFVVFPELFTLQLLSVDNERIEPYKAIEKMTEFKEPLMDLFTDLAIRYNINIIAGSHPMRVGDEIQNVAMICLRDGSVYEQSKIHPTPNERYWWNISGGDKLSVIQTDCGPIGVLICYDSEFPELTRHLVDQGAALLFVPFLTDERSSYCRVRYCCQARAVENQIYVVMSGSVGNLPNVNNMDIHYAQSCILTPCDFPFARDGVAADTTPNSEMVAFADLNLDALYEARNSGTVRNLKDRRHDLYRVKWYPPESESSS